MKFSTGSSLSSLINALDTKSKEVIIPTKSPLSSTTGTLLTLLSIIFLATSLTSSSGLAVTKSVLIKIAICSSSGLTIKSERVINPTSCLVSPLTTGRTALSSFLIKSKTFSRFPGTETLTTFLDIALFTNMINTLK